LPLIAIQLLWINLVTDGLPALALSVDPVDKGLMTRKPRPKEERLTDGMRIYVIDAPIIMTFAIIGIFIMALNDGTGVVRAQTMAFTTVILFELLLALSCRSLEKPVGTGVTANPYLIFAILLSLLMHCAILYMQPLQSMFHVMPLGIEDWLIVLSIALIGFLYLEAAKAFNQIKNKSLPIRS
jgi:Ca2+-transporting ATPase